MFTASTESQVLKATFRSTVVPNGTLARKSKCVLSEEESLTVLKDTFDMPTQPARKQGVKAESFFGRKRMLSSSLRKVRVTELTVCLLTLWHEVSNGRSRLYGKFIF
jgi:hypothetical protein